MPYRDPDDRFLECTLRELDDPATVGRTLRGRSARAIDDRAVTGLRMVDGVVKTEAQPAHIWSVADGGPDIRRAWVELR